MLFLKLAEPMVIDGSFPFAIRVAGLQPGDVVEVSHGPAGAETVWHPRLGPLPWLRATAMVGEFMIDTSAMDTQVTFVATMAGHRAVGATVVQMGGTGQSWSHPGATAREGERWSFLTLARSGTGLTLTARDEPAGRDPSVSGGVGGADAAVAVVDLSASMAPAVADGRLAAALAAVQAAAARSRLTAVAVAFVAGDAVKRVVLPVKSSPADAVAQALAETGWRTGTLSDLRGALPAEIGSQVAWIISDAAPVGPGPDNRRVGYVVTGPAAAGSERSPAVHLRPGESVNQLSDRLISALAG